MDTNKIKEALERALRRNNLNGQAIKYDIREALAELDKAQQPCKVLTDEEIDSAARDHDASFAHQRSFREGARYARDNDYLAPAAGLTADEAEQIVIAIERELDHRETIEVEGRERLHIRLTAALEAKRNVTPKQQ